MTRMKKDRVMFLEDGQQPRYISLKITEHADGSTSILARFRDDKPLKKVRR